MRDLNRVALALITSLALTACGSGPGAHAGTHFGTHIDKRAFAASVRRATRAARSVHEVIRLAPSTRYVLDVDLSRPRPAVRERITNVTNGIALATDQRLVAGRLYVRMDGLAHGNLFGTLGPSSPGFRHVVRSIREAEPAGLVSRLLAGLVSVTGGGWQRIAGERVREVAVVSRPRLARVFADSGLGSLVRTTARPLVTSHVYLNGDHTVRRINTTLQGHRLTIDMTGWNVPTRIVVPVRAGPPGPRVAVG